MYNKAIMVGNLTRDIEIQYLNGGQALAKGSIATSYKYRLADGTQKDEVCFLDFTIFGKIAETAHQYLKKGSKVLFEGRLVFEQWTGKDGQSKSKHSLHVETMKMLDGKNDSLNNHVNSDNITTTQQTNMSQHKMRHVDIDFEEEPPF